jgi:hypothetical protein
MTREQYNNLKTEAPEGYEALQEYARQWRRRNKERQRYLCNRWRKKNKGYSSRYITRRYAEEPSFALSYRVRARVYQAICRGGATKSGRTEEIVGCSFDFLRQHIERQFRGSMSWGNPGSFHIDHIRPLSLFDLTNPEQLKAACHWSNLQPLYPEENIKKGSKVIEDFSCLWKNKPNEPVEF